jgi:hypothetical protein
MLGPRDFEVIDPHRDLRWYGASRSRTHVLLGPGLRWITQEGSIATIYQWEEEGLLRRNLASAFDRFSREGPGQEPDVADLALGAVLARQI